MAWNMTHTICTVCIGFSCSFDNRCDHCQGWDDEKMKYVKHQTILTRKREAKRKARESRGVIISENHEQGELAFDSIESSVDDSDVSIAGSVSHEQIDQVVRDRLCDYEGAMDEKLEFFKGYTSDVSE